jgi:hypothetical protein
MARPRVADGGTASSMEGRYEYIEKAIADSRQGEVVQLGGWGTCLQLLAIKKYNATNHSQLPGTWNGPLVQLLAQDRTGGALLCLR